MTMGDTGKRMTPREWLEWTADRWAEGEVIESCNLGFGVKSLIAKVEADSVPGPPDAGWATAIPTGNRRLTLTAELEDGGEISTSRERKRGLTRRP